MQDEKKTWRSLLKTIISDSQEKQRIAQVLKVNPITLSRWCTNRTKPRYDNVRLLLEALPHYRTQFAEFLADDFPQLFYEHDREEAIQVEIPSAFYGRVLNAYTNSPPMLRSSTISILILQQMLTHIDPNQLGMAVIIIQCMPSDAEGKVRSLRKTYGRGTLPWIHHDYHTQFFGIESQIGQAITSGHPITIQCNDEKTRLFPGQHFSRAESSVVYPILQADYTAGCLLVESNQSYYFSHKRLDLIKQYANLLSLSFDPTEFYDLRQIALGVLPNETIQQSYLTDFQVRVMQKMLQTAQKKYPLTLLEAEPLVWRELEQELLELSLHGNNC